MYPLLLEPILKPRVWGGSSLRRYGKRVPEGAAIGESWEVADLPDSVPDGRSVVANGPWAGRTLRELLAEQGAAITGAARLAADGGFPLLIKYLDARTNLSVQVHPTPEYVAGHRGTFVKHEAWVILEAAPGAVIYRGLRPGVTAEAFAEHVRRGTVADDLLAVPVTAGECHEIPSGTLHALGGGLVVAEVQTPSDTTFRVFDWGRTDRELHVAQALACLDFGAGPPEATPPPQPIQVNRLLTSPLADTDCFSIERVRVMPGAGGEELPVVTNELPITWMVTAGAGRLRGGGREVALAPGVTVLLPAGLRDGVAALEPGADLLQVAPPSPLRGVIANG